MDIYKSSLLKIKKKKKRKKNTIMSAVSIVNNKVENKKQASKKERKQINIYDNDTYWEKHFFLVGSGSILMTHRKHD